MNSREAKKKLAEAQAAYESAVAARETADDAVNEARASLAHAQLEADRAKPLGKLARETLSRMADGPLRFVSGVSWRSLIDRDMLVACERLGRLGFATYERTGEHVFTITDLGREKLAHPGG